MCRTRSRERTVEERRVVVQHHRREAADEERPEVRARLLQRVAHRRHDMARLRGRLVGVRGRRGVGGDRVVHGHVRRLHHRLPRREHALQRQRAQLLCTRKRTLRW